MANGVVVLPLSGLFGEADGESISLAAPREFVLGPENRLAASVVERLLNLPTRSAGEGERTPSPIMIHGQPGSGKSHLVHGLASAWKRSRPGGKILVLSAADFARQYADAVDKRAVGTWRAGLQSADLFVLEDLLQLSTKPPAQAQLLQLLDGFDDRGSLAIVTSRSAPRELSSFLPGLVSRLSAGLVIPLVLPEFDARRQIVSDLCQARGLKLNESTLKVLARSLAHPTPELAGTVAHIELAARSAGCTADDQFVAAYLAQRGGGRQPALQAIASQTARHFALRVAELRSKSRRRGVVLARDVAMYLARQLTGKSLKQIGDYFGGRDHTTVLHGCRKTEDLIRSDPATQEAVVELRQVLATG